MIDLLLKNILTFHEQLEAGKGIRDRGLVESAVNAPFQTFGGQSFAEKNRSRFLRRKFRSSVRAQI
ncbi:MAG: hypothetical protein IJG80_00815 [Selenomonadaceae bacterium]|nr:hypothetical protein [Selenomonadaceae bacterium]MBQ3726491.1 hypothetical protein [Selenomonadaceae bacterium]